MQKKNVKKPTVKESNIVLNVNLSDVETLLTGLDKLAREGGLNAYPIVYPVAVKISNQAKEQGAAIESEEG